MFTPLQYDPDYSPFSSFRNFNIAVNDTCENYFTGYRGDYGNGHPWWLTALRVASFLTVIIPVIFSLAYLISNLLLQKDKEERAMWESKVHIDGRHGYYRERIIDLLSTSGIKNSPFKHICFIPPFSSSRLQGDGLFNDLDFASGKSLVIRYWEKDLSEEQKQRIYEGGCFSNYPERTFNEQGTVYTLLTSSWDGPTSSFKLSNRIKEALVLGVPPKKEKISDSSSEEFS